MQVAFKIKQQQGQTDTHQGESRSTILIASRPNRSGQLKMLRPRKVHGIP